MTKEKKYKFKRNFRTKKDAERAARKLEVERDTGTMVFVEKITVKKYFWDWFYENSEGKSRRKRTWKPATIRNHRVAIEHYIVPVFGQALLTELGRHHVEDWVDDLIENGGLSGEGVAQGTAKFN